MAGGPGPTRRQLPVFDPPLGWLVSLNGPACGQDFTLRSGATRLGTVAGAVLRDSDEVADALITYDGNRNRFLLRARPGRSPAYWNNSPLVAAAELQAGDRISIGGTTLVFVPLTGNEFRWG